MAMLTLDDTTSAPGAMGPEVSVQEASAAAMQAMGQPIARPSARRIRLLGVPIVVGGESGAHRRCENIRCPGLSGVAARHLATGKSQTAWLQERGRRARKRERRRNRVVLTAFTDRFRVATTALSTARDALLRRFA